MKNTFWKIFLPMTGLFVVLLVILFVLNQDRIMKFLFLPTESQLDIGIDEINELILPAEETQPKADTGSQPVYSVIADNLSVPWQIAFLPTGEIIATERAGSLVILKSQPITITVSGVEHIGEGGLMGLAVHPQFEDNNFLYLYLTTRINGRLENRVVRYQLVNDQLFDYTIIIAGIPASQYHNGGRIHFGPDNLLYVTTGDASNTSLAQDLNSLAGKILRLTDGGKIPADNPFNSPIYSYGHRNSQGITWDAAGRLWSTEHGRSGVASGFDELNIINSGKNYGWPVIQGDQRQTGMETPIIQSGSTETWAPAGMVYWDNSIFFVGLRGETLYEAKVLRGDNISLVRHFPGRFGRLRDVIIGPDGMMYLATSNTDGRGQIKEGDDKIIKIDPKIFR